MNEQLFFSNKSVTDVV